MAIRVSASVLPRVDLCPVSAVLPHVGSGSDAADAGSALHQHARDRAELGIDDAVARLEEAAATWGLDEVETSFLKARLMKWEWTPPPGAICEIRLAVWPDWTVTRVPEDERFVPGALFTGAFDMAWADPTPLVVNEDGAVHCPPGAVLWVLDLKGGQSRYVTTIERNLQVHTYAWMAAKWTGAKRVLPAVCFPGPGDGEWDVPAHIWGEKEIVEVEAQLRVLWRRLEDAEKDLAVGAPLELSEGRHCDYCPAQSRCPAKTALLKSVLADDGAVVPYGDAVLTPGEASRLAKLRPFLAIISKRIDTLLRAHVEGQNMEPIPLEDGVVYGPDSVERSVIDAEKARSILESELGPFLSEAVSVDVSSSSIERAIKTKLESEGVTRGVAPAKRRIWAKLQEAGAVTKTQRVEWKAHRPATVLSLPIVQDVTGPGGEVDDLRRVLFGS